MGLETGVNFIDDLVATNPLAGDDPSEGDDHIRAIKTAVQGSFTSLGSAAVTATAAELNIMDGVTKTTSEINGLVQAGEIVTSGTAQATTSGTDIDFTGIPSTAKKVVLMLSEVSVSDTDLLRVVLGDSDGFESTGYITVERQTYDETGSVSRSTGEITISQGGDATSTITGRIEFNLLDSSTNTWVYQGFMADTTVSPYSMTITLGTKSLSGALTQVRLTPHASASFDAGKANILYEG